MDNKFIECPYNKQHKIQRNDIETHFFFKCKAAKNSSIKFKYCQFDNSVFFPKQDEDLHRLQCKKCSENYENLLNQTQISRKIQNEISIFNETSKIEINSGLNKTAFSKDEIVEGSITSEINNIF